MDRCNAFQGSIITGYNFHPFLKYIVSRDRLCSHSHGLPSFDEKVTCSPPSSCLAGCCALSHGSRSSGVTSPLATGRKQPVHTRRARVLSWACSESHPPPPNPVGFQGCFHDKQDSQNCICVICVCVCVCVCVLSRSAVSDSLRPLWMVAHQASLFMGFSW